MPEDGQDVSRHLLVDREPEDRRIQAPVMEEARRLVETQEFGRLATSSLRVREHLGQMAATSMERAGRLLVYKTDYSLAR